MINLKYRAWVNYYKRMYEVLAIEFPKGRVYIETNKRGITAGYVNCCDCEIMQYIGLKTIIGENEIFVGDLLKDDEGFVWEVLPLSDGMFKIYCSDLNALESSYPRCVGCEIIGNIYEKEKLSEGDYQKL